MSLDKTVAISREAEVHELARRVSRDVFMADSIAEASDIIQAHDPDLILFDRRFNPDIDRFLATAENISDAPLVIIGHGDENADAIARFRKMGAYDILRGKADHDRIEEIAAEITSRRPVIAESKAPNSFFANDLAEEISFAGRSEAVKNTLRTINLVANSRCNPLAPPPVGGAILLKTLNQKSNPPQKKLFALDHSAQYPSDRQENPIFAP